MREPVSTIFQVSLGITKRRSSNCVFCFLCIKSTAVYWDGVLLSYFQVKGYTWAQMAGVYSESCCCSLFRTVFFRTLLLGKQGHFRTPVCGNWCHSACGIINENIYPLSIVQEKVIQKRLLRGMLESSVGTEEAREHLGGPERFWVEPDLLQPFDCLYPH